MSFAAHNSFVAPSLGEINRLFPAYEVEGLIAQGGMGAVYKARQRSLDRDVAIKILPREFGADPAFRTSFEAEAKAMARLNHPNLISVYDFGEAEGLLFIIMEFVPGQSLFHSAHGIAIEPREAGRIIAAVCEGLAHAHEHGILHRDIKPANILLTPKAEPKIGDFGLARPVSMKSGAEETIFGTPHYTAPEVISNPERVDTRADIFSVGIMLHELLTGKLPADDPRAPSVIAGCDPRFDTIVRRATHPTPEMRYSDAATMAREITALTDSIGGPRLRAVATTARRFTPPSHTTRTLPTSLGKHSKSPGSPALVIVSLIATVGLIAGAVYFLNRHASGVAVRPNPASPAPVVPNPPPSGGSSWKPPSGGQSHSTPKPPPKPQPVPEPEPQPVPTVNVPPPDLPKPDPKPEPKPVAQPSKSSFDVAAWLEDPARRVMREKAVPILETHKQNIEHNLKNLQRRIERRTFRIDRDKREHYEKLVKDLTESLRDKNGRINPSKEALTKIPRAEAIDEFLRGAEDDYDSAMAKQAEIDAAMAEELLALRQMYIKGIELKIQRLTEERDEAAAKALRDEIEAIHEQPKRFERLMRNLPPEEPVLPQPSKDAKAGAKGNG